MNKQHIAASLAVVFLLLLGFLGTARAAIENHFLSTDGDSNAIQISSLSSGWYFGVFDYGANPSSGLNLLLGPGTTSLEESKFTISQSGSDYILAVTQGVDAGSSINIGATGEFSFYFLSPSPSGSYETDFDITGSPTTYYFTSQTGGGNVIGVDLNAVPIPGSSALLLSGLIGLVALGSRRKNSR